MEEVFMLTTIDNPFNPFTQYEEWFNFDTSNDYHTCSYLARIVKSSDELSDEDQQIAINNAMDEIVKLNINGKYIKVKSDFVPRVLDIENN